jgi:hypothetical protein
MEILKGGSSPPCAVSFALHADSAAAKTTVIKPIFTQTFFIIFLLKKRSEDTTVLQKKEFVNFRAVRAICPFPPRRPVRSKMVS